MPLLQSPPTPSYFFHFPLSQPFSSPTYFTTFSNKRFKFRRRSITTTFCSAPEALPSTELYIEQAIAEFHGDMETNTLPGVRAYENDLGRLTVIGDVSFEQALTAAAADGGKAAADHIVAGMPTMVVETAFPGPSDRSTISTRLFLPPRKVKEKAHRLRNAFPAEMLSEIGNRNILAMTFRQVVLQKVWSFELALFNPGARRNMEDLGNPREVPALSTISSSDGRVLSVLAEAVCMFSLGKTEIEICENSLGTSSNNIFHWFQKPTRNLSKDCSVFIYQLPQEEIIENAKKCLKTFNTRTSYTSEETKIKHFSWASSTYSKLEKIGGPKFSKWASEYVPAYGLQIDSDKLKNIKLECWEKSAENRWEVLLTHSQMVGLLEILDMYYEDLYTVPDKELPCRAVTDFANLTKNKGSTSLWKKLSFAIASAILVISISAFAQLYGARLSRARMSPRTSSSVSLSETNCYKHQSVEATKVEDFCILIIKKIKDSVGWPGDVVTDKELGVWTGELPSYLRLSNTDLIQEVVARNGEETTIRSFEELSLDMSSTDASVSDKNIDDDVIKSAQHIATYQVVLSKDGDIIGFQPTSLVGVNYWASNPLAKELYKGKKLSPGFIEPRLKIPRPDEFILIELLVSVDPKSWFALARPIQ